MMLLNSICHNIALVDTISDWPPAGLYAVHNHLNRAVQPVFSPLHCPLKQSIPHKFVYETAIGDCEKPY